LNIWRPLFDRSRAVLVRRSWTIVNGETFPDVFSKGPKWFHRIHELFRFGVVGLRKMRERDAKKEDVNLYDVTRLKYP
jgi:hypothetical protein